MFSKEMEKRPRIIVQHDLYRTSVQRPFTAWCIPGRVPPVQSLSRCFSPLVESGIRSGDECSSMVELKLAYNLPTRREAAGSIPHPTNKGKQTFYYPFLQICVSSHVANVSSLPNYLRDVFSIPRIYGHWAASTFSFLFSFACM